MARSTPVGTLSVRSSALKSADVEIGQSVQYLSTKTGEWTPGRVIDKPREDEVNFQHLVKVQRENGTSTWMKLTTLKV